MGATLTTNTLPGDHSMTNQAELATRLVGGVWGHLVGDAVGADEFHPASAVGEIRWGQAGRTGSGGDVE